MHDLADAVNVRIKHDLNKMPFQIVNQRVLDAEYAVPTPSLLLCVQRGSIVGLPVLPLLQVPAFNPSFSQV
jgi:hypothetical protein